MIDKQKLLKWIDGRIENFSPPYEEHEEDKVEYWNGICDALVRLKQNINLREFDA